MKTLGTILAFFLALYVFPQDQKIFFHEAISTRIFKYNDKVDSAISRHDDVRADFLFDSLFTNYIKDTYVKNLKLNKVNGGSLETDKLKVPFILITKSTSFNQNHEEIELINDIANRYRNQIKFIILYYGDKKSSAKISRPFNSQVIIAYSDERENNDDYLIATYKHSFGVPACFFVSATKQITYIDRAFTMVSKNLDINSLETTNKQLALLLFKEDNLHDGIITDSPNLDKTDF
ncbi:hypothetical protein SAMN03097699_0256 [Flavobacteriaceae bacterium MAR_2010_188]|nr:hypothetical protein SAMN03097699_0256 [Flavobacteriaceae bacterium MAR_2010_188]